MASRSRRVGASADIWAGFVDALSTLLVVLIFALVVFMLAQFFQGIALSGRDRALAVLENRIAELADMLALEREEGEAARRELARLSADLQQAVGARDEAERALALLSAERDGLIASLAATERRAGDAESALGEAGTHIGLVEADLERALQEVSVSREQLALKLAEIASLQRDIDALAALRQELEGDVARMALLLEEAAALQRRLEGELATSQASETARAAALDEARVETGALESEAAERLAEMERLAVLVAALRQSGAESEAALAAGRARIDFLLSRLGAVRDRSMALEARLADESERTLLAQREIEARDIRLDELAVLVTATAEERAAAQTLSERRANQIALLNRQLAQLRAQLTALGEALEVAEAKAEADRVQIAQLGARLNAALAAKVQELARYRSLFFEKLVDVLGNRRDIKVVGDRFVLQSELLFDSGSADISPAGRAELDKIATLVTGLEAEIPPDVAWILRVDGHTDAIPISTPLYATNWELSTGRATSVVRYLVSRGVPPWRLAAAGFGEFQPLDDADDEIAYRRNRRIEFKLTQR